VLRHQKVLQHRHGGEQADVLERPCHPRALADLVTEHALQQIIAIAAHQQAADGGLVEAGDAVEDRGLAGAVGADDGGDLLRPADEGDVVDGDEAAEAHGEVLDLDQGNLSVHPLPPEATGCRRIDGSRWPIRPRGRNTMINTMAMPKVSMR
jgi:hypothetical protein